MIPCLHLNTKDAFEDTVFTMIGFPPTWKENKHNDRSRKVKYEKLMHKPNEGCIKETGYNFENKMICVDQPEANCWIEQGSK